MKQAKKFFKMVDKKVAEALLIGAIFAFLFMTSARFIFKQPESIHFHANMAVFIDGKRELFAGPGYYEEVEACSATATPSGRTHLHMPDNNVVHVHDKNVTWGNFFENIGWAIGPDALIGPNNTYRTDGVKSLTFLLNGEKTDDVFRRVIKSEDVLVVSYGDGSANFSDQTQQAIKPTPALLANSQKDPAACRGSDDIGVVDRLKKAIW